MPRRTRSDGERRHDDFERRTREDEYRTLARELHREWCERLDDDELSEAYPEPDASDDGEPYA